MLGKERTNILVLKFGCALGDVISGSVALILKKPVRANELSISLVGEQVTMQGDQKSTRRIFNFRHQLDSEKEYSEGREYHFEVEIPADILTRHFRPKRSRAFTLTSKGFKEVTYEDNT